MEAKHMRPHSMQILQLETYLAMIRGSVGSNMFRTLWANVDGQRKDILKDGELSCAFFVSSLLFHFKLIESPRATVDGLIKDMERSGWQFEGPLRPGAVYIWEKAKQAGGEEHLHAGFFVGNDTAISHSDHERTPVEHHSTFGEFGGVPIRKLIAVFTHPFLRPGY